MKRFTPWVLAIVLVAAATAGVLWILGNIAERKEEARSFVFRIAELTEQTVDPAEWGKNFPRQYEAYLRTAEPTTTRYGGMGGSDTLAADKLAQYPQLKTIFAGYAFGVDYRARRGHAYMLSDQRETLRVKPPFRQTGACLHCHASNVNAYRKKGLETGAPGRLEDPLGSENAYAQLLGGFVEIGKMPYAEATKLVDQPMSCVDCHDPESMEVRVTRPAFLLGIQALAASGAPVPHLSSIEKWRSGSRAEPYDPNRMASRQEMRSLVCAQCHVEYYCASKADLFYPWNNGLKVEDIERHYSAYRFSDGTPFSDWTHAESGAEVLKAQHPEFELWSQGIHARSGVACADCHMPYRREGAVKISDHFVRSPLLNVNNACQVCHPFPEAEILARVETIQDRNHDLLIRAEYAVVDLIRGIKGARDAGAGDEALKAAREFHRGAQWRVDFVRSENSMGFHAPQEAARILGEAIDLARKGQIETLGIAKARQETIHE
ncbi:MAG: ammonia-forming cytochrome c nitrite reductase subunit c552 [Acidobacteria bacterium]|nr:ammonia-forming cytochrome c nitrite reductase subunit c552 [Acidobacteriota bacterium]